MASGGADRVVRLWDPDNGQQSGALHGMTETVTDLAWTCDAKFLLASGADQAVRMWDVSSGRVRHTLTGHTQKAHQLLLFSDGTFHARATVCSPRMQASLLAYFLC